MSGKHPTLLYGYRCVECFPRATCVWLSDALHVTLSRQPYYPVDRCPIHWDSRDVRTEYTMLSPCQSYPFRWAYTDSDTVFEAGSFAEWVFMERK